MSLNAAELQKSIDTINAEINKLSENNIDIEDWDNVGEWALKEVEWDKKEDKIYFRTEQIDARRKD